MPTHRPSRQPHADLLASLALLALLPGLSGAEFSWQDPQATVLPHGELELRQEPYQPALGPDETVRYIDHAAGDDDAAGSREAPWRHHPWDPAASGRAAAQSGPCTYVFKGGVDYRGVLRPDEHGSPERPIRLIRLPDWGEGPARILGSRRIDGGWQRGATHPRIPEPERVWWIDLDISPRTLWLHGAAGLQRLQLARDPDWSGSDPLQPSGAWYEWENPQWWTGRNKTTIDGRSYHFCTDRQHLVGSAEDFVGATVWTEWGPVMGSPYPHPIIAYDPEQRAVAFGGPWTPFASEGVWQGHRYFLEDKPQWLDRPGEFWFARDGRGGRLFLRLPQDADPNRHAIEVGEHIVLLDAAELRHVEIAGLDFACTGLHYDYAGPQWSHPEKRAAAIRIGSGDAIDIHHCRFEHLHQALRIAPPPDGSFGTLRFADNSVRHADQRALEVVSSKPDPKSGAAGAIAQQLLILRNDLAEIGFRVNAGDHGHAIQVSARHAHIAGNHLHRLGGAGINLDGGHNGPDQGGGAVDSARYLVHHNRVEQSLLQSCDWGAFYLHTHGGGTYLWSNVAIAPIGSMHGGRRRLGMAYYLDGAYDCALFNNIAIGHDPGGDPARACATAFKSMVSFQNTIANNTAIGWRIASNRQSPQGARERYLGNVFVEIGEWVFEHAKPKDGKAAANAAHEAKDAGGFRYETNAYHGNVIHAARGAFGVFEREGDSYPELAAMRQALQQRQAQASTIGLLSVEPPLRDAAGGDLRPRPDGAAIGHGVRVFVPWALARTVGQWQFLPRADDPSVIEDEHWYQTGYHLDREMYRQTPRYPLRVDGLTRADYRESPLEDWIDGAIHLSEERYAVLAQSELAAPFSASVTVRGKQRSVTVAGADKQTVDIHDSDLLIELQLRSEDRDGVLVAKQADGIGYRLELIDGRPHLQLGDAAGTRLSASAEQILADGHWHHLLLEVDRSGDAVRFHLDGTTLPSSRSGSMPTASLRNPADFTVGGGPGLPGLSMDIAFLRVARATLAAAQTSIEELHAWQTDGPARRDFTGRRRGPGTAAGAIDPEP